MYVCMYVCMYVQLNLSTVATLGTAESNHCREVVTWDQALFSLRFVNNIPAGMAKWKEILAVAVRENVHRNF